MEEFSEFILHLTTKFGGGGGGGQIITIFDHLTYVRVSWSNGQQFLTMTTAEISILPWSNGQNWSTLTVDHRQVPGFHSHFYNEPALL